MSEKEVRPETVKPHIPEADYEDITYVTGPPDTNIVRRVRAEDLQLLFARMKIGLPAPDNQHPLEQSAADMLRVEANMQDILKLIREKIIWGVYSHSGMLRRIFEEGKVRRLTTPEDARAFKELYLRGLKYEPELFGSSYDIEAAKSEQDFEEMLKDNYVAGISHSYMFDGNPKKHKLVGMGVLERLTGHRRHIARAGKLFIDKGHRLRHLGLRVAQNLMEHAVDQEGLMQIRMIVTATNKHVIDWYKRAGCVQGQKMPNQAVVNGVSYDWVPMFLDLDEFRRRQSAG